MPAFPREELEEMVRRWVEANDKAGRSGDWSQMEAFYSEDAVYSWNNGARHEFVARGPKQILGWAFGSEMAGLEHWTYPYVRTLIDERKGEVVGFWRQVAPLDGPDGKPYEIAGTGGSWFRYAGDFKWCWQRDFFDHANAGATFLQMAKNNQLSAAMQERMKKGADMPGWVSREAFDWYQTLIDPEA